MIFFEKKVRTRIAPSPTGFLHVGSAHTALFNYVFIKQNRGKFILRIDDTDKERSKKKYEEDIINGLKWLGFKYDKLYRQSERSKIYKKYLKKLLKKKLAFHCYHTKEELSREKEEQKKNMLVPKHVCEHKTLNKETSGQESIIRLNGSKGVIKFNDLIRGDIEYKASLFGDMAIAKDEDTPLYNFATVIDDYKMKISHIIRGEDHIPNTPKQILIQKALGIKTPIYAHLPLILGKDRSKLSKRDGATSVNEYLEAGYLPEAFINFLMLLGWNPGDDREVMKKEELFKIFSLQKVQKGGAIFNIDKLNWFNKEYLKLMPTKNLAERLKDYVPNEWQEKIKKDYSFWEQIVTLEKERLTKLSEIQGMVQYFFIKPTFSKALLVWKETDLNTTVQHLDKIIYLLSKLAEKSFSKETIKEAVWDYAEKMGRGNVLWPFRVALTGQTKSPDPFSIAEILGKRESLERLEYAKNQI